MLWYAGNNHWLALLYTLFQIHIIMPDDTKLSSTTHDQSQIIKSKNPLPNVVVVHPLVLLSVVDHYTRVARDTNKRVVGVLLGEQVLGMYIIHCIVE